MTQTLLKPLLGLTLGLAASIASAQAPAWTLESVKAAAGEKVVKEEPGTDESGAPLVRFHYLPTTDNRSRLTVEAVGTPPAVQIVKVAFLKLGDPSDDATFAAADRTVKALAGKNVAAVKRVVDRWKENRAATFTERSEGVEIKVSGLADNALVWMKR